MGGRKWHFACEFKTQHLYLLQTLTHPALPVRWASRGLHLTMQSQGTHRVQSCYEKDWISVTQLIFPSVKTRFPLFLIRFPLFLLGFHYLTPKTTLKQCSTASVIDLPGVEKLQEGPATLEIACNATHNHHLLGRVVLTVQRGAFHYF